MQKRRNPFPVVLCMIAVLTLGGILLANYYGLGELLETPEVNESSNPTKILRWTEGKEDEFAKELTDLLLHRVDRVTVSGNKKLGWTDVCKYNFWVQNFCIYESAGKSYVTYEFIYKDDAELCREMKREVDKEVKNIIDCIPSDADDWHKLLIVHDELIRRVQYDKTANAPHTFDIYGALVNHVAVCQGYTYAMSYIASQLGIRMDEVYSDDHVWNQMLDAQSAAQYVDVTWDDIDQQDMYGEEYVLHNCFCLDKEQMQSLEDHSFSEEGAAELTVSGLDDNFYRRMGYYIPAGDREALQDAVYRQYVDGSNVIELQFEDSGDYSNAEYEVTAVLASLGYDGRYYMWSENSTLCKTIGLNALTGGE